MNKVCSNRPYSGGHSDRSSHCSSNGSSHCSQGSRECGGSNNRNSQGHDTRTSSNIGQCLNDRVQCMHNSDPSGRAQCLNRAADACKQVASNLPPLCSKGSDLSQPVRKINGRDLELNASSYITTTDITMPSMPIVFSGQTAKLQAGTKEEGKEGIKKTCYFQHLFNPKPTDTCTNALTPKPSAPPQKSESEKREERIQQAIQARILMLQRYHINPNSVFRADGVTPITPEQTVRELFDAEVLK